MYNYKQIKDLGIFITVPLIFNVVSFYYERNS